MAPGENEFGTPGLYYKTPLEQGKRRKLSSVQLQMTCNLGPLANALYVESGVTFRVYLTKKKSVLPLVLSFSIICNRDMHRAGMQLLPQFLWFETHC